MGYPAVVERSIHAAEGRRDPVGWVFMVHMQVKGPLRATKEEAVQDAVEAGEARVDFQYGAVFMEPLTWIAPVYP